MKRNVNNFLFFLLTLSLAVNIIIILFLDKTLTTLENESNLSSAEFSRNISSCLNDTSKMNATMHQVVDYCNLKVDNAVDKAKEEFWNISLDYVNETQWSSKVYREKLLDCAERYTRIKLRLSECTCPFE